MCTLYVHRAPILYANVEAWGVRKIVDTFMIILLSMRLFWDMDKNSLKPCRIGHTNEV